MTPPHPRVAAQGPPADVDAADPGSPDDADLIDLREPEDAASAGSSTQSDRQTRQAPVRQLGILQFAPQTRTVKGNVAFICKAVRKLEDALVLLPEFFLTSYRADPLFFFFQEDELTESLEMLCRVSREQRIRFFGSLPVTANDAEQNRAIAVAGGALSFPYSKRRLFGPEGTRVTPGSTTYNLVDVGNVVCTVQICFDIFDPGSARRAARAGADIVLNPASVSVDYLRTIGRARALENQVVHMFANRCGEDAGGTRYLGQSVIFLPDGTEAVAAGDDHEGLLTFSLDKLDLEAVRQTRRALLTEHLT